ncbi:MAG: ACP S-malonyltransferase, partial [Candidatus Omnitrophica bacterium]|nr:ACP S-malonyltransferase [Candidatus Omnitrophota bacterium]
MVGYLFPGQGAQYVGMGKAIYEKFPAARWLFHKAEEILKFDLKKVCFEGPAEELVRTENSQPAILLVSIASKIALESSSKDGIPFHPEALAGLSLGEYSALVCAGSISFEDAIKIVRLRGKYMEEASQINPGKMASIIGLTEIQVKEICTESGAELANLNCPGQIVVSGRIESINKSIEMARIRGAKRAILLDVSGPFHTSFMKGAGVKLGLELDKINISSPQIPVLSNVTADYVKEPVRIKGALVRQVSHPVRWEESVRLMIGDGIRT